MVNEAKEKTALAVSGGTDARQSFPLSSNDSITISDSKINGQGEKTQETLAEMYHRMQRMNDPAYLHTITMQDLYENVYQSRPPIIDGLLYSGTYLFAGAPKVGKSFFMAQLAYHISTGEELWGYTVHPGTVLYLALEDDYQRLQERMFRMFGVNETDKLHFAVYAKQLDNGLCEQLERFIGDHPDTRLIIIDTLQKIRELSSTTYSYADDYQIVGKLKKFSDKTGICMLVVHHTRKMPAGDTFEMISGTTGLLGCADGAFVLQKKKRTDNSAVLDVVGRDQPDQRIYLTRDEERLLWCFDHAEQELWKEPPDPLLEAISKIITAENPSWTGSASMLASTLGLATPPNALAKKLNIKASKLMIDYGIQYSNTHTRNGSWISLSQIPQTV